jgi:hypothetical protein
VAAALASAPDAAAALADPANRTNSAGRPAVTSAAHAARPRRAGWRCGRPAPGSHAEIARRDLGPWSSNRAGSAAVAVARSWTGCAQQAAASAADRAQHAGPNGGELSGARSCAMCQLPA